MVTGRVRREWQSSHNHGLLPEKGCMLEIGGPEDELALMVFDSGGGTCQLGGIIHVSWGFRGGV